MDLFERKALIDAHRAEIQQMSTQRFRDPYYNNPHPPAVGSRARADIMRTRNRSDRIKPGESGEAYINRTSEGGDGDYAEAARRYDLHAPRGRRAPTWGSGGYAESYDGLGQRQRMRAIGMRAPIRSRRPDYAGRD